MPRILVIDDDPGVRDSMERMLRLAGYTVQSAASGEEGFDIARGGLFDVILSDMRMPGISGIDVLRKLRDVRVDAAFIVMTGFGTVDTAVEAMKLGAVDFVQKPFFRDELLMRVRSAADRRQLARQVELLQRQMQPAGSLDALVGESPPMLRAKDLIGRAAAAGGTVLITGETGTGKELAARAIHAASTRAAKPFVALNCAALTESLLENELFGHARGAFTGAAGARPGLIEHASGGTLFFDEIGTMPKTLQAKLLRALEAGEVRRIGENENRLVDVRFVAATNVDLTRAVETGDFRRDLFYRLNVHRVHLPALREREGDVRRLSEHFLARYGNGRVSACSPAVWDALLAYDYPGNVRQLQHIIQRAVAVAQGAVLETGDLSEEVLASRSAPAAGEGTVAAARERGERDMLVATLARHHGEISSAARELQVSRTTMWRLMKKHGIGEKT
ncbi:MAG TPA: sigma-54 dependent transcriptional regulator [Vicinamibacterales bacterium]|jgi:two-component system response regulator HydG|nr:sigma-54 dependent transcriptional regulator [Vicinamibacterales bacterium]